MLEAPKALLDERRRLGLDRRDEMWEGVLHMVPPASGDHQRLGVALLLVVGPLALSKGLTPHYETGLYRSPDDYRVPDLAFARTQHLSARGIEGAELVVEILSPGDESYDKLAFYAGVGVPEVLLLDPVSRAAQLFRRLTSTGYELASETSDGVACAALGVEFSTRNGQLHIAWEGGSATV